MQMFDIPFIIVRMGQTVVVETVFFSQDEAYQHWLK